MVKFRNRVIRGLIMGICIMCLVACGDSKKNANKNEENTDETKNEQSDKEKVIIDSQSALALVDFVVEVESGRDPIILHLTDTQIIDSAQMRTTDRLGQNEIAAWATDQIEERCFDYLTEVIEAVKPDLIIMTGDNVYGEFDDKGTALKSLVKFMESFGIPWAPILGNHDAESKMGVDWQCKQYENAEHCLFKQRTLSGNGNYTVGIKQDGQLRRVFFMMDSHGCGNISDESVANGHTPPAGAAQGFKQDQIDWYTDIAKQITGYSPITKYSFAIHIPPAAFARAADRFGLKSEEEGEIGLLKEAIKDAWDHSYIVWNGWKTLGVDSVFVGHIHLNNGSTVYNGIRCQYGTKSSAYDKYNVIGGTVNPLSAEDGSLKNPYLYLCE